MELKTIKRSKDMISGREDLMPLYTIRKFPIYMGVTDLSQDKDEFADEEWMISEGTGMVQLGRLVPAEILYDKSHNSSIGKVWKRHHECLATFINKHGSKEVLEIGGGNGRLNAAYNILFHTITWSIVEPSAIEPIDECDAKYIRSFWDENVKRKICDLKYDTLVHSHLMEHQFDLNEFMKLNSEVMQYGMKMIFSVPNMKELLIRKYPYALNFEHTYCITEDYIDLILQKYGYETIEKEYFEDHSIFYCTIKKETHTEGNPFADKVKMKALYDDNYALFMNYINHYKNQVTRINDVVEKHDGDVYIFGAHINTQLLLSCGLLTDKIISALDNDKNKQGHRLYGTSFRVESPKVLANSKNPLVILVMGAYAAEIKEDILTNINADTIFIDSVGE